MDREQARTVIKENYNSRQAERVIRNDSDRLAFILATEQMALRNAAIHPLKTGSIPREAMKDSEY